MDTTLTTLKSEKWREAEKKGEGRGGREDTPLRGAPLQEWRRFQKRHRFQERRLGRKSLARRGEEEEEEDKREVRERDEMPH